MDLNIEQLNILRDWPTDSAIRNCFKDSFSIAEELCEALGINVSSENNLDLPYVEPVILVQNWVDNDISTNTSKQVESLSLLDDDNILELDTTDLTKQVDLIQNIQHFSSLISIFIILFWMDK
ncbi:unnamed protein product [Rhizophagus irregularis]|nr:unnamed protein product [Rhizophagus irregularis]